MCLTCVKENFIKSTESVSLDTMGCELNGDNEVRNFRARSIHVQLPEGTVFTYEVDRNEKAGALKRRVQAQLTFCTEQTELVLAGQVLENNSDLSEVLDGSSLLLRSPGLSRSQSTPCLEGPKKQEKDRATTSPCKTEPIVAVGSLKNAAVENMVRAANHGIKSGEIPVAESDGLGGAYYFKDRRGERLGIIKPTDEEPFAPNNPKGFVGKQLGDPGFKRSVRVGEAAIREAAAYLLDHNNFCRVPLTCLVKARHPIFNVNKQENPSCLLSPVTASDPPTKLASFQAFVTHDYDANEHSCSRFPVSAVHRIGILDIRLFNTDRHSGNILVRKPKHDLRGLSTKNLDGTDKGPVSALNFHMMQDDGVELIPIDHGYCLPENVEAVYFEWLYWPQASHPFTSEELAYIASLDAKKDIQQLRTELPNLPEASLRLLDVSTTILQKGAAAGLSLADLGNILSRPLVGTDEEPSDMERLCAAALLEVQELSEVEECRVQELPIQDSGSDDETSELSDQDSPRRHEHSVHGLSEDLFQFELDDEAADGPIISPARTIVRIPEEDTEESILLLSPGSPASNHLSEFSSSPPSPVSPDTRGIAVPRLSEIQAHDTNAKLASSCIGGGSQWQTLGRVGPSKHANCGTSGWQRKRERAKSHQITSQKGIRLGELSEAEWEIFRATFAAGFDRALKEREWRSSMQLVTDEGSRLQKFGTSCPAL